MATVRQDLNALAEKVGGLEAALAAQLAALQARVEALEARPAPGPLAGTCGLAFGRGSTRLRGAGLLTGQAAVAAGGGAVLVAVVPQVASLAGAAAFSSAVAAGAVKPGLLARRRARRRRYGISGRASRSSYVRKRGV